ncbi:MAG: 4Fe-4S dicluster domain-containing protein [Candidatus Kariarchaeaceae archaeon]|jgi:molybdopterin-containing oxidoreductase family iron-sulfur binding subunit
MKKITRRSFLKGLAIASATTFLFDQSFFGDDISPQTNEKNRPYDQWRIDRTEWIMIIDLAKCDGCTDIESPRCTIACIDGHFTPNNHEYIKVFKVKKSEFGKEYFFPRPCQQCRNPPCVQVCPVSAAWQRDGDKLTLIDHDRCIGCRLCMAACPYDVRYFHFEENPKTQGEDKDKYFDPNDENYQMPFTIVREKGVTAKCEFCGLQFIGKFPHCVSACDEGALYFGNIKENVVTNNKSHSVKIDEIIRERAGFRYKEEEGTQPRVIYLPANEEVDK